MICNEKNKQNEEFVLLSLGSNMGDREENLEKAFVKLISEEILTNAVMSSFYETEPVTLDDQKWFVNTAISGYTCLPAEELLEKCQTIEKELGRRKNGIWSERIIDIDIILYGDEIIRKDNLIIPHPRFNKRNFVLIPTSEVAGDVIPPGFDKTIKEICQSCDDDSEVKIIG